MKTKLLLWLSLIVKYASLLAGLSALPQVSMLPPKYLSWALLAFAGASLIKDTANRVGDLLDDGVVNQSFKVGLLLLAPLLLLSSCVNDAFLGVNKAGWIDIGKAAASGALKGAAGSALPAYSEARMTSAKAVSSPFKP